MSHCVCDAMYVLAMAVVVNVYARRYCSTASKISRLGALILRDAIPTVPQKRGHRLRSSGRSRYLHPAEEDRHSVNSRKPERMLSADNSIGAARSESRSLDTHGSLEVGSFYQVLVV